MQYSVSNIVRERQNPLCKQYRREPKAALIRDRATTPGGVNADAFHGTVLAGTEGSATAIPFGIHRAVGGFHDRLNPGDLLCAALAACLDSTIRIIAERLGVVLTKLEVDVQAEVDVRGTLVVERDVPVAFQRMHCRVDVQAAEGTHSGLIGKLLAAAEYSCVNLQTLRNGINVETSLHIDQRAAA